DLPTKDIYRELTGRDPEERGTDWVEDAQLNVVNRRAQLMGLEAQSQYRWTAEVGAPQIAPFSAAAAEAAKDGVTSPAELRNLDKLAAQIDPKTLERMGRTEQAIGVLSTVYGLQRRTTEDRERLLADHPELVDAVNGSTPFDPSGSILPDSRD